MWLFFEHELKSGDEGELSEAALYLHWGAMVVRLLTFREPIKANWRMWCRISGGANSNGGGGFSSGRIERPGFEIMG